MGLTYQEAWDATNPGDSEQQRDESARRIMAGVAANEAYWNSRSELEALKARAEGHGVIVRGPDDEGADPTVVGTGTESATVEGTAVDEPSTALASGGGAGSAGTGGTAPQTRSVPPSPDNPTEAVARLRAQLQALGETPEA